MMLAACGRLLRRNGRCLLVAAVVVVGAGGASAAPALAAAPWSITMTHANAYGVQGGVRSVHRKDDENGKTFSRDSASNTYTITVTSKEATASKVTVDRQAAGGNGAAR